MSPVDGGTLNAPLFIKILQNKCHCTVSSNNMDPIVVILTTLIYTGIIDSILH